SSVATGARVDGVACGRNAGPGGAEIRGHASRRAGAEPAFHFRRAVHALVVAGPGVLPRAVRDLDAHPREVQAVQCVPDQRDRVRRDHDRVVGGVRRPDVRGEDPGIGHHRRWYPVAGRRRAFRPTHASAPRRRREPAMSDDVQQTVFSIIAKEAGIDEGKVTLDSTLKDLEIPSLDAIQIIFEIEDHFKIQMPDRDPNFDTESVKGLVDTVEKLLAEKAANPPPPPASTPPAA